MIFKLIYGKLLHLLTYIDGKMVTACLLMLGAWSSAFFSQHLLRDWYLDVVAKTICRMQANAGDFVRDSVKEPLGHESLYIDPPFRV